MIKPLMFELKSDRNTYAHMLPMISRNMFNGWRFTEGFIVHDSAERQYVGLIMTGHGTSDTERQHA